MPSEIREQLVADWIVFQRTPETSPEYENRRQVVFEIDALCQQDPEQAWHFILEVLAREPDTNILGVLAAGPFEDLLEHHGAALVERVESLASRNERFRWLLRMLYQSVPEHLWVRIKRAAERP